MRVALVGTGVEPIPPTGYGGVERTIAELAEALGAAGAEVRIIHEVRHRRPRDEYWFAWDLPARLRAADCDVIHASTPVVAIRLALAGIPYVYTTHSRHWFDASGLRGRYGRWLERRALRRARATIALTERLRARLVDSLGADPGRERLPVIPIGVDLDRFRPSTTGRQGGRALGVGLVAPVKRWELAAAAAAHSGYTLRIVGPIADRGYADRVRSAGAGRVELLGEVDEPTLRDAFDRSDVLVHPSSVELLAGVVLQAMACGLPVLGAAPVRGLFTEGVSGWTTEDHAPEAIVAFLSGRLDELRAAPDLRSTMGRAARAEAEARYAWPAVAAAHLRTYERARA